MHLYGHAHIPQFGGDYLLVRVSAVDGLTPEQLAALPITYQNGRNDDWTNAPKVFRVFVRQLRHVWLMNHTSLPQLSRDGCSNKNVGPRHVDGAEIFEVDPFDVKMGGASQYQDVRSALLLDDFSCNREDFTQFLCIEYSSRVRKCRILLISLGHLRLKIANKISSLRKRSCFSDVSSYRRRPSVGL